MGVAGIELHDGETNDNTEWSAEVLYEKTSLATKALDKICSKCLYVDNGDVCFQSQCPVDMMRCYVEPS